MHDNLDADVLRQLHTLFLACNPWVRRYVFAARNAEDSACLPPSALQGSHLPLLLDGFAAAMSADASVLFCCCCLLDTTALPDSHLLLLL